MKSIVVRMAARSLAALMCILPLLSASPVYATSFNFYYHMESGSILSGMLEGTIEADGDTVQVTSVAMAALDDWPGPPLIHVQSFLGFVAGTPEPARVSFSGAVMDIIASTLIDGGDGFLFATSPDRDPLFSSGASFGDTEEFFDREFWYLVDKNELPEPTSALALLALCLPGLLWARRQSRIHHGNFVPA